MNMLNVASNSESDVTKSRYRKTNRAKSLELSVYGRKKKEKKTEFEPLYSGYLYVMCLKPFYTLKINLNF